MLETFDLLQLEDKNLNYEKKKMLHKEILPRKGLNRIIIFSTFWFIFSLLGVCLTNFTCAPPPYILDLVFMFRILKTSLILNVHILLRRKILSSFNAPIKHFMLIKMRNYIEACILRKKSVKSVLLFTASLSQEE